jgi:lipoprotein-releasing system permease protein
MFKPAALFIGLRYTRAKRRNHFISFISIVSTIGIALGVMVLITVLSVMNGFDQEIKKRVFSMVSPLSLSSQSGALANWQDLQKTIKQFPQITASAPYVTAEVLLTYGGANQPSLINGILPSQEKNVSQLVDKMVQGDLSALQAGRFRMVIGEALAEHLGIRVGDKMTVVTTQLSLSPAGVIPRFKRFTVVGIFSAGSGFGFDAGLAFIHLNDAQKLLGINQNVTGLHLNIRNVFAAQLVAEELRKQLSPTAVINTWVDQFGEFFHAVKLEKTMMFFILILILAVAAFNMVSTLVMVVSEKEADIAILRTIGATPAMIMQIFIVQGGLVGIFGTLLGVLGGIALATHVTAIVNSIEHLFHVQFLSSSVYFVNYLPSDVQYGDVLKISIAALLLSFLATLYPAWRASKLDPVESLRYE